jgi:biopolymer transport protein ExbD/biopolymer transport protein TolR
MPPANGIRRTELPQGKAKPDKPDGADVMGINKRDEGKKVNSNINVTPMVDVMLVLLIIFMVITPMLNNKVNVDLPTANAAIVMENANKEDAVIIAVTRDGKTFLGANQVNVDDLGTKVSTMLENKTDKEVYMRADQRANYGKVMDAVDGVRSAGVNQLGLLTEKNDSDTNMMTGK